MHGIWGLGTHEVDADGRDVALCVCVVSKAQQEARLADTGVADEDKLEDVVVLLRAARELRQSGEEKTKISVLDFSRVRPRERVAAAGGKRSWHEKETRQRRRRRWRMHTWAMVD